MNTEPQIIKAAKKPHRCTWCGERIQAGESYVRWRYFDGGDAGTNKMHPECDTASARFAAEEGPDAEFMPGDFKRGCTCERGEKCDCDKARITQVARLQDLIGMTAEQVKTAEVLAGRTWRFAGPAMFGTADCRPGRINVHLDARNERVTGVIVE